MNWLIIVIVAVAIIGLIYLFYPYIKKAFTKKQNLQKSKKESKVVEAKKDEKSKDKKNVQIVQNEGDLFSDDLKIKEDPDTKVNYDNFDFGGFFEDESNTNIKNAKTENKEDRDNSGVFNENFDEIFDKYFSNKPEGTSIRRRENSKTQLASTKDDDEMDDFLRENIITKEDSEIKKQLDELPDEMKALILSGFLNKKY